MEMHASATNTYISLARGFQKHSPGKTRANGLLDHSKDIKRSSKRKWTNREYHLQYRKYVSQTSVQMSRATTQLPEFHFAFRMQNPMD